MPLTRKPDWQTLLEQFLRDHQYRPFRYGVWDCCLFVCDAILEMTGTDPAAAFRGKYSSRKQALTAIYEQTGRKSIESIVEQVTDDLQMPEIRTNRAARGDVVLIERPRELSIGLVALNGYELIVVSQQGLWRLPPTHGLRAWQV